ncbi:MAG: hypothetical protein R2910_11465 [Gemmatimonadales bacterium]
MTPRRILPALGLLGALATSAPAQDAAGSGYVWAFRDVSFSACVDFLMDREAAEKQLAAGFQVIPASSFTPLSPALSREVEGDSAKSAMIPAQFCIIEAPAMTSGDALYSPTNKMGMQEAVGYWGIAATRAGSAPTFDRWFVAGYWTNDWRVQKKTQAAFIPVKVFKRKFVPVPETSRQSYSVSIGKTAISWTGEMVGRDSTADTEAGSTSQMFEGRRTINWNATVHTSPRWTRTLPGVFHVEGKDDLAKALKGSPIRMFGPMQWGGEARIEFYR